MRVFEKFSTVPSDCYRLAPPQYTGWPPRSLQAGPPAVGEDEDGGEAAGSRHLARPVSVHIASTIKYYFILMYIKTKPK
jgi:hypothetical protein